MKGFTRTLVTFYEYSFKLDTLKLLDALERTQEKANII